MSRVYTVNGATAASSSSLPDWLTRKRNNAKGGKNRKEHYQGTIELIQGFEFPEASIKIKTTPDGKSAIATGTYKPQIKVWDLDQLSQKFERHSDAENIDFICLSDDWTKSIHLQNDRTIQLHTQGGTHYKTRIPKFGRALAYHFPSCDALFSAEGNEIYRLNLDQGRFMSPLQLHDNQGEISGVNVIDVNKAHGLLAFGIEGNGSVQFWDPRSRSGVGLLRLPTSRLLPTTTSTASILLPGINDTPSLDITSLASHSDGLSYAIGTSTGHTLLYDIRARRPFAIKDLGYGLPVKNLSWVEGRTGDGEGLIISSDKKVIKIWSKSNPSTNFASITPDRDINHVHHVPNSGLLMTANEGIQMGCYYLPGLGPAPSWARFLENVTEEMDDTTLAGRSVYEDYKFVERGELRMLGLDHLVGTPALKPYMHGYFLSLKLYDSARLIANPFAYEEHRDRLVKEKLDKLAEGRIRTKKDSGQKVKVNKALAEKVQREEEKARKREERKKARKAELAGEGEDVAMEVDEEKDTTTNGEEKQTLLNDPRFSALFSNPEFTVDESSREYALMNPSAVARKANRGGKTAVEDEEDESDKASSDGLGGSGSESESGNSSDSSDAGELNSFDPRARPGQKNERAQQAYARNREQNRITSKSNVNMVPLRTQTSRTGGDLDKNATFGQRRSSSTHIGKSKAPSHANFGPDGGVEMSWVPSSTAGAGDDDDMLVPGGLGKANKKKREEKQRGVESFGAGMERGGGDSERYGVGGSDAERRGRTERRKGVRSGSKNTFRRM